jgi:hypothetical protein
MEIESDPDAGMMKVVGAVACCLTIAIFVCVFVAEMTIEANNAKQVPRTKTVTLPAGEKFVGTSQEGTHFDYVTRPMVEGEQPQTYTLRRECNLDGVYEVVVIHEVAQTNVSP